MDDPSAELPSYDLMYEKVVELVAEVAPIGDLAGIGGALATVRELMARLASGEEPLWLGVPFYAELDDLFGRKIVNRMVWGSLMEHELRLGSRYVQAEPGR